MANKLLKVFEKKSFEKKAIAGNKFLRKYGLDVVEDSLTFRRAVVSQARELYESSN